jgi:hypothetical protein
MVDCLAEGTLALAPLLSFNLPTQPVNIKAPGSSQAAAADLLGVPRFPAQRQSG